jgi:hypothetical protein
MRFYQADQHGHLPKVERKTEISPDRVIGSSIRSVSAFIRYPTGL